MSPPSALLAADPPLLAAGKPVGTTARRVGYATSSAFVAAGIMQPSFERDQIVVAGTGGLEDLVEAGAPGARVVCDPARPTSFPAGGQRCRPAGEGAVDLQQRCCIGVGQVPLEMVALSRPGACRP